MKKALYVLLALLFPVVTSPAQVSMLTNISTDNNGHIAIAGYFQDSIGFKNATIHSVASIRPCTFLACLDTGYNLLWYRVFNSYYSSDGQRLGMVNDSEGSVYFAGSFAGTIALSPTVILYNLEWETSTVIAKYDALGNLVWHKEYKNALGYPIENTFLGIDSLDNVYLASTWGTIVTLGVDTVHMAGPVAYIAKFTSSGVNAWLAKMLGQKEFKDFQVDRAGNSLITGTCSGPQVCGPDTLSFAGTLSFTAKCSPSGSPLWQRLVRGPSTISNTIGVGPTIGPVIMGYFNDSVVFNVLPSILETAGSQNMFFAGYNDTGNETWSMKARYDLESALPGDRLRIDGQNNIYFAGHSYSPSLYLDTVTISLGVSGIHLVKMDSGRNVRCTANMFNSSVPDMTFDKYDNLYLFGRITGPFLSIETDTFDYDFHATPAGLTTPFYIARFDSSCQAQHVEIISSSQFYLENVPFLSQQSDLVFAPNPVNCNLNIHLAKTLVGRNQVVVTNLNGQLMYRNNPQNQDFAIDVSAYPPGMYLIALITDGARSCQKFIKN